MASRLRRPPVTVGNRGSVGSPGRSPSQALRTALVAGTSGVRRSLRPLPTVWTLAPAPSADVLAGEVGQLRDPQPGLDGEGEHGVVPPARPAGLVAGAEQRVDLGVGQVGDQVCARSAWAGWRAPAGWRRRARGGAGQVGEQGWTAAAGCCGWRPLLCRSASRWPKNAAIAARRLCDVEGGRAPWRCAGGEAVAEPQAGLVGADRVGLGGALAIRRSVKKPAGRCERAHGCAPKRASSVRPPGHQLGRRTDTSSVGRLTWPR